jgi:hypothetical protein
MVLPTNFLSLTIPEQMFVLTNLERVDRGVAPIEGLAYELNAYARAGANAGEDPGNPGAGHSIYAGAFNFGALFGWMYDDGCTGPPVTNADCADHPSFPWGR